MFWTSRGRIIEKTFPDGEKNIWGFEVKGEPPLLSISLSLTESPTLIWKWNSDADLITLMLLKKCYPNFRHLQIMFLPYSREDREGEGGSNCSLRYIGEFIQQLGFETVTVYDPHSDLTLAYLGTKAKALYPNRLIRPFLELSPIGEVGLAGILSIVSDTWDLWYVMTHILPKLKPSIMKRDGKVVIRPDSGDPVLIICGDPDSNNLPAYKGVVELLWETFGGTVNEKGFKVLDPHIGAIYGDAITHERCIAICEGLMKKGFASTNVVFGIGSFTYQYVTRDTYGFALKSTHVIINGKEVNIFKDPKTDNGVKKSAIGRVAVVRNEQTGEFELRDGYDSHTHVIGDMLLPLYENGTLLRDDTLANIRRRLATQQAEYLEPEFEKVTHLQC